MDVSERLTEQDLERNDYLAASHLHRYEIARDACAGLRVLDLGCGIGYGTEMLATRALSAHGVDIDAATIASARTRSDAPGLSFSAGDALEFLRRTSADDYDAIVMFEALEHLPNPEAVLGELARLSTGGTRLLVSVPNSRAFRERNPFHVTDFGYAGARRAFGRFGDVTMLYQVLAEGSLILSDGAAGGDLRAGLAGVEYAEPEYANTYIALIGFDSNAVDRATARLNLVATPAHNRYMLELERANREIFHTNRQLARGMYGKQDAAAATAIVRLQELEARVQQLEIALRNERAWRDAPRYHMVDRLVETVRRVPGLHQLAALAWRVVGRGFTARGAAP